MSDHADKQNGRRMAKGALAGLAIALVVQFLGSVWWGGRLDARVEALERDTAATRTSQERLARVEATLQHVLQAINRIETLIARGASERAAR